ncbi:serine hydrolase domain-containing protein [Persicobacter diffluens]
MRLIIIFSMLLCAYNLNAQNTKSITAEIDEYLNSAHKAYKFNGVALVYHKNELLLNKGYGYSQIAEKVPNSTETKFPILSITKTITASIILKLQDEKKLSVKDKLNKYFPEYPNGSKISIHHLITHSSGIYNYTTDVGIEDSILVNNPVSKDFVVNYFKDKPLGFKPGKYYSYNNSGYFLLGLIIEKVTGKQYETVVREYLFEPFKMSNSGFDFNGLPKNEKAQGYQFWNQKETISYKHYDSTFAYSAGSIYSTSSDLLQWAKVVSNKQFLKPKTWELAFKPKIRNYGYGWEISKYFDKKYIKHSGGYPGFMSELIYYPNDELIIILLNNYGTYEQNVWAIGMGITSIVLGMPYDKWTIRNDNKVEVSKMQKHVGQYKSGKGRLEIKLVDDNLFLALPNSPDMRLLPENENQYFLDNFNTRFDFNNGKLVLHEHGKNIEYIKQN